MPNKSSGRGAATRNATQARALELRRQLEQHNYRYYVLDDPAESDSRYDRLLRELQTLSARGQKLLTELPLAAATAAAINEDDADESRK